MLGIIPDVRAYVGQYSDYPIGVDAQGRPGPISGEHIKWTCVPITMTLGGANVDDDDNTYNGPANFVSLVFGIEAHLGMNDISAELLSVSNIGNPSLPDRLMLKAQNYKVSFENIDKEGGAKIFNSAKRLSSLMHPGVWLPIPIVVPKAETLKVTIDSVDEAADVTGGATVVGLDVWILQVRCSP